MSIRIHDDVMGEMTWDAKYSWWRSQTHIRGGQNVEFIVRMVDENLTEIPPQIKNKINHILAGVDELKRHAASDLLELFNSTWIEDESNIDAQTFMDRMTLCHIYFGENGHIEVDFDADDMFSDHVIYIEVDPNGKFAESTIR